MPILRIPGVFGYADDATTYINASVWTIPYEIFAYIILTALFVCGVFKKKYVALALFAVIIAKSSMQATGFLSFNQEDMERSMLPFCFAFGSILALYKEKITPSLSLAIMLWILYFLLREKSIGIYSFYTACFYSITVISGMSFFIKMKPKHDISYGVYLWGWPVQQVVSHTYPNSGIFLHVVISITIALLLGYLSWMLVERHAISYGKKVASDLTISIKGR